MTYIIVDCPHCSDKILIYKNDLNCRIFRHGVYKKSLKQMNPHEKKEICDKLKNSNLIYGCGKPFKIIIKINEDEYAEIYDYI